MSVKISVVSPVYNVENYLEKCLDSLLNQTFDDFEIICVNDGSTDSSLDILESYAKKDSRFKIITQENRGLSGARNTGIKEVTGEYTLFVDSDDWLEVNALEELSKQVDKTSSDITMFKFRFYNEDLDNFSQSSFTNLDVIPENLDDEFNYGDVLDILFKISHAPFNKLYKTEFLNNSIEFPEGVIYEDLYFFYTVFFNAEKCSVLRKIIYNYMIREDSISTTGDEKSYHILKVLNHVQDNLISKNIYDNVKDDFLMFIIVNLKYVYLRIKTEFKESYFNLIKRNYDCFNLGDVKSFEGWHYEDEAFYKSISISKNTEIFDLNFEKFQYKILAKHYETLSNQLQIENNQLKEELNSKKSKFKKLVRL